MTQATGMGVGVRSVSKGLMQTPIVDLSSASTLGDQSEMVVNRGAQIESGMDVQGTTWTLPGIPTLPDACIYYCCCHGDRKSAHLPSIEEDLNC